GVHPGAPDRDLHGLLGGSLRGLLQLRALRPRPRGRVMPDQAVSDRELEVLGLIENVRSRRPKFRDAQITMAHGAGGKASQTLVEGLFVPILGGETLAALGDAGEVEADGVPLAGANDSSTVKPARPPRGASGARA